MSAFERPDERDPIPEWISADADKAAVMVLARQLVRERLPLWVELDRGEIELSFSTGEVFHFGELSVKRIA
jgi:hypothetical protein